MSLKEIWKPIRGYEDFYFVSNLGNVKSKRLTSMSGYYGERILKPGLSSSGYRFVHLSVRGQAKMFQVHRLVAEHFVERGNEKAVEVNHIDRNKMNNKSENLEWVTHSENQYHMHENNPNQIKGEKVHFSKLTVAKVIEIKKRLRSGELGFRIAKDYGVSKASIYAIKDGKTWKHVDV